MRTSETTREARNKSAYILTSLMLIGLLGFAFLSLAAEGEWTRKADMPTPRWCLGTSVVDGIIYAFGGTPLHPTAISTVEAYTPLTDTWTRKADMPMARNDPSSIAVGGKICVIGGITGNIDRIFQTVEEYTPEGWPFSPVSPRGKLPTTWGERRMRSRHGLR